MKTSISRKLPTISIALSLQDFSLYRLGQFTEKSIFCRCLFGVFPFAFEHDKSLTPKEKYHQRPRNSHSLVFSLCCVPQCRASQQAKFRWSNIKAAPPKAVSSIFCQLPWIGYDEKLEQSCSVLKRALNAESRAARKTFPISRPYHRNVRASLVQFYENVSKS